MSAIRELVEFIPEHSLAQANATLARVERRLLAAISIDGTPLTGD